MRNSQKGSPEPKNFFQCDGDQNVEQLGKKRFGSFGIASVFGDNLVILFALVALILVAVFDATGFDPADIVSRLQTELQDQASPSDPE